MSTFDLLSMAELTASAAILVSLFAAILGASLGQRVLIVLGFAAWFAAVLFIGVHQLFTPGKGLGIPGLGMGVILPVASLTLMTLGSAAGRARIQAAPLWLLTGVHSLRVLGVSFLMLQALHRLPTPFAPAAGWGDILVALLALPLSWSLWRAQTRLAATPSRLWIGLWNTLGLADLAIALFLGASSSPGPIQVFHVTPSTALMTTPPWILIPSFLVPSLIFLHLCIYYRVATLPARDRASQLKAVAVTAS